MRFIYGEDNYRRAMLIEECYPRYQDFINNDSKFKAMLNAKRRTGKTFSSGVYLLITALTYPDSNSLYIAQSKNQIRAHIISNVLVPICEKFQIEHTYNNSSFNISFPNGSTIHFASTDESSPLNIKGKHFRLAIMDECDNQLEIAESYLKPAMLKFDGTIVLISEGTK